MKILIKLPQKMNDVYCLWHWMLAASSGFYEVRIATIDHFIMLKMYEDTVFIDYSFAKKTKHTDEAEQYTPWYDEY